MAVAAVLAQEVADVPHRRERVVGNVERSDAGCEVAAIDREHGRSTLQQFECAFDAIGTIPDETPQLADRPVGACGSNRGCVGSFPGQLHRRHDHGRAEHPERRRDHLAGYLAEQAAATGEVGGPVGECDTVGVARARVETERHVVRMTLGREVHLPDHWFEYRTQAAGQSGRRRELHGPPP